MNDTRPAPENDLRSRIVEATMRLAASRPFGEIAIRDVAAEAGVTLMQFRDSFPSKGAVLAGLARRIDRETLGVDYRFGEDDSPEDRLYAVLSRRLEALGPYRAGLKSVRAWLRADWASAIEMNKVVVNSMRFCCEAAKIDVDGPFAAVKLQGLALAWARVLDRWIDDEEAGSPRTLGALHAELSRGQRAVSGLDGIERALAPVLARAAEGWRARGAAESEATENDLSTPL